MSNINPQNIDGTYPIAGQDNNSQGFRDNFTNTVNNFTFAAAELQDLQTYALLAAPLGSVGQTTTENNNTINYTIISEPQFKKVVETTKFIGNTSSGASFEVDWAQGHFQSVGVTSTATMSFASTWPTTNLYTRLRLQITSYGTTAITLPSEVSQNVDSIQGVSANVLTIGSGVYQFEFSTKDQGATVAIRDLWRNYDSPLNLESLSVSGNVLSTGLRVFGNTSVGLTGKISGSWHTVVGNITQTSSGGAVYFNTTGNVLAAAGVFNALTVNGISTNQGVNTSGNIIIADPLGADKYGANLTLKGTYIRKVENYTANATTSSRAITLAPGGDDQVLLKANGNLAIAYNAAIVPGAKVEVTVWQSGANAWVNLPNTNTNLGKGNVFVLGSSYTRFVFTSFGTDSANVAVSTDGRA